MVLVARIPVILLEGFDLLSPCGVIVLDVMAKGKIVFLSFI